MQEAPSQDIPIEAVPGLSNHAITKPQAVDTEDAIKTRPSNAFYSATAVTATSSGAAAAVPAGFDWLSLEDSVVSSF